jgi:thymidylate kinase
MLALCREVLAIPRMRPDLYVLLDAGPETIDDRQVRKNGKDRNATEIFRAMYYKALAEIHQELNETNIERVRTDSEVEKTLDVILAALKMKGVAGV